MTESKKTSVGIQTETDLDSCAQKLSGNGFEVFRAATPAHAHEIFFSKILPELEVSSASWGDSMTMLATGALERLESDPDIELIRTFEEGLEPRERIERRRQALLVDLFLTGSNAVTLDGKLVNLDMIGNRTAALAFGPKKVVLFVGRNKLVANLDAAFERVRNIAAPLNAKRHRFSTPCASTGRCHDCSSPQRICNTWTLVDKCFPKGRIKVVLIDADLGL